MGGRNKMQIREMFDLLGRVLFTSNKMSPDSFPRTAQQQSYGQQDRPDAAPHLSIKSRSMSAYKMYGLRGNYDVTTTIQRIYTYILHRRLTI